MAQCQQTRQNVPLLHQKALRIQSEQQHLTHSLRLCVLQRNVFTTQHPVAVQTMWPSTQWVVAQPVPHLQRKINPTGEGT